MSHRVGALLLPVPPPAFGPTRPNQPAVAPILDPALDVLGAFFAAMLDHYCGQAWGSIAPGEPLVRKLSVGHDPEELDFSDSDIPLLALWRDGDGQPTRLQDGNVQTATQVNILWVAAPADEQKLAARSPFFNAFCKMMALAFQQERDPCWIKPGEQDNVVARTYGSYVWGHAGIDGWNYGGTKRVPVVIAAAGEQYQYAGYLATWTIQESTSTDGSAFGSTINGQRVGVEPTSLLLNLTTSTDVTEDDPPPLVVQQALIGPGDD